jgi:acyl-CoA synthetase (NDP forming)
VLFIHSYDLESDRDATLAFIKKINILAKTQPKPVVFCMLSEKEQWFTMKDEASFPVFSEAEHAMKALARSWDHFRKTKNKNTTLLPSRKQEMNRKVSLKEKTYFMAPDKAFELLRQYDLPVADYKMVGNFKECREVAHLFGYPVALKTASPDTLHKTEKGGVKLNLTSDVSLKEAFKAMKTETYIVQKMAPHGYELIIGAKRDPAFGQVLIFGMGGIYAELFNDISVRMVPVNEKSAVKMISEIKGSAIFKGYRGESTCDLQAVAKCIAKVSRLLSDHPEIVNLDINPLIAYEKGKGCVIVDAKIETSS